MGLLLSCVLPEDGNVNALVERIQMGLASLRIPREFDARELAAWLRNAAGKDARIEGAALVEGRAPVPPVDGRIEWASNFFDKGFVMDPETGTINYRQRLAQRSVTKGQKLVRVIPPRKGSDGVDVFGKPLRVAKAKPARILAGQNVRCDESEQTYHASIDGRIHWVDVRLSVDPVYHIVGNVGLETGNVDHLGAIEVEGDVEAGATVNAAGDIEVKQVVESAVIVSGGNVTVRGGIMGVGGKIRAAGAIHARFLLDADIEADDDVVVEREIVHTTLKTAGAVNMPKGRLIGGETTALGGIIVGQAGSAARARTVLIAGADYRVQEELAAKEGQMRQLEESLNRLKEIMKPMVRQIKALPPQRRVALAELIKKAKKLRPAIETLRKDVEAIKASIRKRARFEIEVRERAYPEVLFCIAGESLHVQDELRGPVRVRLLGGRIELQPMT